jgi:hypothetical protein
MTVSTFANAEQLRALQRDNQWLGEHLEYIWQNYFQDTPCVNPVQIAFAKRWKSRLGSICLCEETATSHIRINVLLSHPVVPDCLLTITVAHELVHYAHGFGSLLPRRHTDPHKDSIVERELIRRGLDREYEHYLQWIEEHWDRFYHMQMRPPRQLWLPRKSGEPVRLYGESDWTRQAAASLPRVRRVGEEASQPGS